MPQTWTSDGTVANIQNIHDTLAADGDTITVPVGTFTWSTQLGISKAITLAGATTVTGDHTSTMTANDQTILLDAIPRGGFDQMISIPAHTGDIRITGLTFRDASTGTADYGAILTAYYPPGTLRIDHCHFDHIRNKALKTYNQSHGVMDHCVLDNDGTQEFAYLQESDSDHNGVGGAWAAPDDFGTDKFFFFEDNTYNYTLGVVQRAVTDANSGARFVVRYNTIYNSVVTDHGIESGTLRSVRIKEIYNNKFIVTNISTNMGLWRGGTGVVHDNQFSSIAPGTLSPAWSLYYFRSVNGTSYGVCSGYSGWDLNSTVDHTGNGLGGGTNGKIVSGATVTNNVNATTNPGGTSATINVSNNLGSTNLAGKQLSNVGKGTAAQIISNTATSITFYWFIESDIPTGNMPFASGDGYLVYDQPMAAIDQQGRGQGDLLPQAPGTPSWPNQALSPLYAWNNTMSVNGATPASTLVFFAVTPPMVENRDFFNNTVKAGYSPYVYPHPLISTDSTPPVVSITAPASGATVFGSAVTISANATDNVAMAGVTFKRGSTTIGAEVTGAGPTYSISWDTTLLTNGSYTLHAIGRDTSNNTTDVSIPVTVTNSDVTPPVVAFTAPAAAAIVANTVSVSATASDNVAVAGVTFKYGTTVIGVEQTSSPYSVNWDTTMVPNGAYTLHAVGRDTSNNTTDVTRAVTVTNVLPPNPPPPEPVKKKGEKEGDATQIPIGAQSLTIAFAAPTPDLEYQFEELEVENIHNSDPMILTPVITEMTTDGFTVQFNGTPDTTQYFLRWKIIA